MNEKSYMSTLAGPPIDNYTKKLLPIVSAVPQGTLWDVTCYHDNWCGIYSGRRCNCDPDVVVVPLIHALR